MKKILTLLLLFVVFIVKSQSYSHTPKTISTIPTDSLTQEVKIKNKYNEPIVFIIYRYKQGDSFWEEMGSVTVFSGMQAKFYVKRGYVYGAGEEGFKPRNIGPAAKKWKVEYKGSEY